MVKAILLLAALSVPLPGAVWNIRVIDTVGMGDYTSLKIDRDGNAHVAFVADRDDKHVLRYGYWDHVRDRWFVMNVANSASFCSLALDSDQRPHLSWADYGTGEGARLRYGHWDGTAWKISEIPLNSETVAYYTSIVLDGENRPTISFYEYRGPRGSNISVRMRVVSWNGKFWEVRTIDGENQSGKFNALAVDNQNRIHLVYANVGAMTAGLRYARRTQNGWELELIEDQNTSGGEYFGYSSNITVDKNGEPHVVYANRSHPAVKYAERTSKGWQTQTVDRLGDVGYPDRFGIAISESGTPYISYHDAGLGLLKVAWRRGNAWMVETVDEGGVGFTSSLTIHGGQLWVTYADGSNGTLKVARRDLGNEQPEGASALKQTPEGQIGRVR